MRKSVFVRLLAVGGLVAGISLMMPSCGSDNGKGCSNPPNLTGNWNGTLTDKTAGGGVVAITFTQSSCSLGGIWGASFLSNPGNNGGTLTGLADDITLMARFTPSDPNACAFDVTGTLQTATTITGIYSADNCSTSGGGTFSITKQSAAEATATATITTTPGAGSTATPTTTATSMPTATPTTVGP